MITDDVRLDLLENAARGPGGILLHCGPPGLLTDGGGLSLNLTNRSLREAVDTAFGMQAATLKGLPHVVLTKPKLEAAVATWVIARKADLLPDTRGEAVEDLQRLEALTRVLADKLWSLVGGSDAGA